MEEDKPSAALTVPDFPAFSVQDLISQGNLLLASSGKEFIKPAGILATTAEVKKARKEAMGRLGLEFLDDVADDIELEKELAADMEIDATENPSKEGTTRGNSPMDICDSGETRKASSPTRSLTPVAPSPTTPSVPDIDLSALSARERNRLKRKRKQGNGAFVAAPPPQGPGAKFSAAPIGSSNKCVFSISQMSSFHE
jgi:TATA-binding protein-associated factor